MKLPATFLEMMDRVSKLEEEEIDRLISEDQCPYEPEHLIGVPVGMFHCPLCGEMVLGGVSHPRYSMLEELEE